MRYLSCRCAARDAQADQEIVLLEKATPGIVQQRAIGLNRVPLIVFRAMFLLVAITAEKIQPHQRRLTALPGEGDSGISCDEMYCWIYRSSTFSGMRQLDLSG